MSKTKLKKTFSTLDDAIVDLKERIKRKDEKNKPPKREIYPARYDQPAINNIAQQVSKGVPLTDKQQELAVKLVTKYHRQWKKLGIDVSHIDLDTPVKMPIRTEVDRDHLIYVEGDRIQIKFPYKPRLIGFLSNYGEFSRGKLFWDKDKKVWSLSITPDNITWTKKFAKDHNFQLDKDFETLYRLTEEAYDYNSIQLDIVDNQLVLRDAPESMLQWIHTNIGKVEMKNLIRLVSYSHVLAFTLSDELITYTIRNHPNMYRQILNRQSWIRPDVESMRELLLKVKNFDFDNVTFYIVEVDDVESLCKQIERMLPDYNITTITSGEHSSTENKVKSWSHSPYKSKEVIVTNKHLTTSPELIISFAGFMSSPGRRSWFGQASKVIYYCHDLDKNLKKAIKKHEGNFNNKRRN